MSPKLWLFDFLSRPKDLESTTLAVGCWHIWEARNDVRNNQVVPNPKQTSLRAVAYIDMIQQNCFKPTPVTRRVTTQPQKWSPPPPGKVLVNVDPALFADRRCMAMGAVLRDHNGSFILAASEPLVGFSTPELAEALALRRAMLIAREQRVHQVIFESDCLSLINRLKSSNQDRSQVGSVVMDIRGQGSILHFGKKIAYLPDR
uniref:Uncharacterized protein n=1 Tax=Avena sativa TaxID=4498 RepID=A0ACD5Y4F7_AVESA